MRLVIPSVNYGDLLQVILPAWLAILPREAITVVTAPGDQETRDIATGLAVDLLVTDAWRRDGAVFNKAAALDEAFGFVGDVRRAPADGGVCLSIDVDIFPFGGLPTGAEIKPDTLYGCPRFHCPTPDILKAHLFGTLKHRDLQLIAPRMRKVPGALIVPNTPANVQDAASRCLGYFQLFRYQPGIRFGSYRTAGKYDLDFREQFTRRLTVPRFYALHLGDQDRRNWQGRVTARWEASP